MTWRVKTTWWWPSLFIINETVALRFRHNIECSNTKHMNIFQLIVCFTVFAADNYLFNWKEARKVFISVSSINNQNDIRQPLSFAHTIINTRTWMTCPRNMIELMEWSSRQTRRGETINRNTKYSSLSSGLSRAAQFTAIQCLGCNVLCVILCMKCQNGIHAWMRQMQWRRPSIHMKYETNNNRIIFNYNIAEPFKTTHEHVNYVLVSI